MGSMFEGGSHKGLTVDDGQPRSEHILVRTHARQVAIPVSEWAEEQAFELARKWFTEARRTVCLSWASLSAEEVDAYNARHVRWPSDRAADLELKGPGGEP